MHYTISRSQHFPLQDGCLGVKVEKDVDRGENDSGAYLVANYMTTWQTTRRFSASAPAQFEVSMASLRQKLVFETELHESGAP